MFEDAFKVSYLLYMCALKACGVLFAQYFFFFFFNNNSLWLSLFITVIRNEVLYFVEVKKKIVKCLIVA